MEIAKLQAVHLRKCHPQLLTQQGLRKWETGNRL